MLRTTIDRLVAEDSWFAIGHKIAAIYPAHAIGGTSYANGLTRMIYLHQGKPDTHWHPDTVIHEFIHLWNYAHNHGTINWVGAVCSLRGDNPVDLTTHNVQENPSVAFAEGFELGGQRAAARVVGAASRPAVQPAARGPRTPATDTRAGREVRLRGRRRVALAPLRRRRRLVEPSVRYRRPFPIDARTTTATALPTSLRRPASRRSTQRVVPAGPDHLALWDVLRVFRANPGRGWDTDWQVGNVDYGIVRFIDRACDIHRLGDDVRQMLKRSIDPLATDEPRDALALKEKSRDAARA